MKNTSIDDIVLNIKNKYFFIWDLLTMIKIVPDKEVPNAKIDLDTNTIYYNKDFIKKNSEEIVSREFLMLMMHVVLNHKGRKDPQYSDEQNMFAERLEIASLLKHKLGVFLSWWIQPEDISLPKLKDKEYYLSRMGDRKSQYTNDQVQKGDKGQDSKDKAESDQNGDGQGKEQQDGSGEGKIDDQLSEAMSNAISKVNEKLQIKDRHKTEGKSLGSNGNKDTSPMDLVDRNYYSLVDVLKSFTSKSVSLLNDFSYAKINNRFEGDIIFPGRINQVRKSLNFALIFDISGSMDSYISKAIRSIMEFKKYFNRRYFMYNFDADIFITDTEVKDVVPLKKFDMNHRYYGGGTDLIKGLEEAKRRKKYDEFIIFTDGCDDSIGRMKVKNKKVLVTLVKQYHEWDFKITDNLKVIELKEFTT